MTVRLSRPRRTARITFEDGRVFSAEIDARLEEYVAAATAGEQDAAPAIAAIIDGKLTELNRHVRHDGYAKLVRLNSADGARIYRRSLTFLLIAVARKTFPEAHVYVEHSITNGGYFCQIEGRDPLTKQEIAALEREMRQVVEANLPIQRTEMPLDEAMALFEKQGDTEKLELLKQRHKPTFIVYSLLDTKDYFHGYMAPSTGHLRYFALELANDGFLLRFPQQDSPTHITPIALGSRPPLFDVFTETSHWLRTLGIRNVAGLNRSIEAGRLTEVILVSEALHEQRISNIAAEIAARRGQLRVVLIAGPSSSGKTTFARRLAVRLLALGIRPLAVSVDDYFVDRAHTPRDENGEYDFESLYTVDLLFLNRQINQLIAGESVQLPHFDFHTGERGKGHLVQAPPHGVLIVEGIHALNPALLPEVDPALCYRVYVSALTQLNLDRYNRASTTDTRLLRRIVRDVRTRGYSATETIARWESVRRGERRWIFPHQNNADVMFNSALPYELSVLKPLALPLLRQIEVGTPEWIEANRLLARLQWFRPGETDHIPSDSILREFIGGSILEDYRPWLTSTQVGSDG
ncbi:MAG TPA: nucleoside kinase [Caldilineae bacterium]|nr:nucleoside kinase [Caldilineae bacterium]